MSDHRALNFIMKMYLVYISYSDQYQLKEMYYYSHADFSQLTPINVPQNPENAPAQQVFTHLYS